MIKRVMCFGDSNTWGFNPLSRTRYEKEVRWTGRLAGLLGEEYEIIEEGLNGRTTAFPDLIEPYRCGLDYIGPCVLSHTPFDLMILMLGTNDAKERFHVSSREISYGIEELIGRTRFLLGEEAPQILIVSPIPMEEIEGGEFTESSRERVKGLAAEYERVAKDFGCGFLDAAKVVTQPGPDKVHMTPEQHARLAEAIARKIKEMLK